MDTRIEEKKRDDKLTKRLDAISGAKTDADRKKARNKFKREAEVAYANATTEDESRAVKEVEEQRRRVTKQIVEAAKQALDPEIRCLLVDASPESYVLGPEYALRAIIHGSRDASKKRAADAVRLHEHDTRRQIGPLALRRDELQRRSKKDIQRSIRELESARTAELREVEQEINMRYNKLLAEAKGQSDQALVAVSEQISELTKEHERFILDRERERDAEHVAFDKLLGMIDKARAETST